MALENMEFHTIQLITDKCPDCWSDTPCTYFESFMMDADCEDLHECEKCGAVWTTSDAYCGPCGTAFYETHQSDCETLS